MKFCLGKEYYWSCANVTDDGIGPMLDSGMKKGYELVKMLDGFTCPEDDGLWYDEFFGKVYFVTLADF